LTITKSIRSSPHFVKKIRSAVTNLYNYLPPADLQIIDSS